MTSLGVDPSLLAMADAFERIHEYVEQRPGLEGFVDATRELLDMANRVKAGEAISSSIRASAQAQIPSEEVARDILHILKETSNGDVPENAIDQWSWLGLSLTKAIMHAIMRDYPHLTRDAEG